MSSKANQKVVFQLVNVEKTSYERSDGTFIEYPAVRRISPTYEIYNGDNAGSYRHIRTEKSPIVSKQNANAQFVPKRDDIYLINGFAIFDVTDATCTLEFMRNYPKNWDNLSEDNKAEAVFKEIDAEKEGIDALKNDELITAAKKFVYELRTKKDDDSYSYNESKIAFMLKLFNMDATMVGSSALAALIQEATQSPVDFIYTVTQAWGDLEAKLTTAVNLKIITYDKKGAFLGKKLLFNSEDNLNKSQMEQAIIAHLVSIKGQDDYGEFIKLLDEAQS